VKAVILAAGNPGRDFPPGGRQKCLLHQGGRVLLDISLDALFAAGVRELRVVLGYNARSVEAYLARKSIAAELVYNEDYARDSVRSLDVGLAGLDDDALIVCPDLVGVDAALVEAFLRTDPRRLAWIRSEIPWDHDRGAIRYDEIYRPDIDNSIVKIPRHLLGLFEGARARADRFIARYHWETPTGPGTGVYFGAAITETFWDYRPIEEVVIPRPLPDVDYYHQTDEYRVAFLAGARRPRATS